MTEPTRIMLTVKGDHVDAFFGDGAPMHHVAMAAEYLCYVVASKSGLGFEKALDLIRTRAMLYRTKGSGER